MKTFSLFIVLTILGASNALEDSNDDRKPKALRDISPTSVIPSEPRVAQTSLTFEPEQSEKELNSHRDGKGLRLKTKGEADDNNESRSLDEWIGVIQFSVLFLIFGVLVFSICIV
ncbi:hypothetical protein Plhal304r1_c008g0033791 [Plasmopara halstedii]